MYLALDAQGLVHRCHPAKSVSLTVARVEMGCGLPGSFQSPPICNGHGAWWERRYSMNVFKVSR